MQLGRDEAEPQTPSSTDPGAASGHDHTDGTGSGAAIATTTPANLSDVPAWSSPSAWPDGEVPEGGAEVTIPAGSSVRLDRNVAVDGLTIDGALYFEPSASVTLTSTANIVVNGTLHMKPAGLSVNHVIEFTDIDEAAFVGDSMAVVASDVGLWVMDDGQLNIEGTPRRGWSRATAGVDKGASTFTVQDAAGWQVGDEISISPTAPPGQDGVLGDSASLTGGFHESTIAAIDGNEITIADATSRAHPMVAGQGAEVMNLTRNVVIRGSENGRAHVFIHAQSKPQFMRWALLEWLGVPGKLGRYPLHIHHSGSAAYGSLYEGIVARNNGLHAFVPHESHGITMRDMVAYATADGDAYWWDNGDYTHDLLLDHVISAGSSGTGFYLGRGTNMTINDAVGVGVQNQFNDAGFEWENGAVGNWTATNLVAHNNAGNGIRVWQNADIPQVVDGYVGYHNRRAGIDQGAYSNRYIYRNVTLVGNLQNGVVLHATGAPTPITFENLTIDPAGIGTGSAILMPAANVPAQQPVVFRNLTVTSEVRSGAIFDFTTDTQHQIRCIDCTWPSGSKLVDFQQGGGDETWLEIVDGANAQRYTSAGVSPIEPPVGRPLGDGTGLTVEYFDGIDLSSPVFTTVAPGTTDVWEIDEDSKETGFVPYYRLNLRDGASSRWTGELEVPQSDGGDYTLYSRCSCGVRLWVGDQLLIDDWENRDLNGDWSDPYSAGYKQATATLAPGRHPIKVETVARADASDGFWGYQFQLLWQVGNRPREIIPASQLLPSSVPDNAPVATTQPQ